MPVPLTLQPSDFLREPAFLVLGPEARGVLLSLLLILAEHDVVLADPETVSRMTGLPLEALLAHWDTLRRWFPVKAGVLTSPIVDAYLASRTRRANAARVGAAARHSGSNRRATAEQPQSNRTDLSGKAVDSPSSPPGIISPVPSPTPPTSLMGLENLSGKEEIPTPCARVAPPVPKPPTRTPRPKVESSTPPSYRDLFANPDHLEWFDKAVTLRSEHVARMPARLREVGGVAGHKPNPAAVQFLARVKSGYNPRLLAACLYLYLEHDENVQRGYVQGLDVFFGNPSSPKAKATFQAYLAGAAGVLSKADAKRAAGGADAPAGPSLPSVSPDLLAGAGMPLLPTDS